MVKKRMGLISLFISVLLVFSSLCLNTFAEAETSAADTETVTETLMQVLRAETLLQKQ